VIGDQNGGQFMAEVTHGELTQQTIVAGHLDLAF